MARNRDVDAAILTLAENLKATTIDAILAKSDLELGLEALTGRSPLFPRDPPRPTSTVGSAVLIRVRRWHSHCDQL